MYWPDSMDKKCYYLRARSGNNINKMINFYLSQLKQIGSILDKN